MPDDRLFHKRLGHSEKVSNLTDLEFRVWSQYQLSADDCGVMRCSAIALQTDNDALAKRPSRLIQKAIDRILSLALLGQFEHQGQRYLYQPDWQNFQRVRYPRSTIHPIPPAAVLALCTRETKALFQLRHGDSPEKVPSDHGEHAEREPQDSGDIPADSPSPTGAGGCERLTANGNGLRLTANGNGGSREHAPATARSKRPIFTGQRLTVFEWMLDDCVNTLGEHLDAFDLHEWFFDLDARAVRDGLVIPKRDGGVWLQAQLVVEAQRRGLPLRMAVADGSVISKRTQNLAASDEDAMRILRGQPASA